MEKSYPAFWRELTCEYTLLEAGLGRFVDLHKPDFVGRAALLEQLNDGVPGSSWCFGWRQAMPIHFRTRSSTATESPWDASPAPRMGTSSAIVSRTPIWSPDHAAVGEALEVSVLGERRQARIIAPSPFDPGHVRPRS